MNFFLILSIINFKTNLAYILINLYIPSANHQRVKFQQTFPFIGSVKYFRKLFCRLWSE